MKALLLAAGKGTRLGGAAEGVPKPLVTIAGTTPLEHNLRWLAALGVETIWINVHAHAAPIMACAGDAIAGVPIRYSHEPELLGTAGAWRKLAAEWRDTSLVVYGDNLMHFDLGALLRTHAAADAVVTVALFDPGRHAHTGKGGGRATLSGTRIARFVEGGAEGLINAGVYCVEPELADELADGFLDFGHDVLPALAAAGRLAGHMVEESGYCLGIDTPQRLALARELAVNMEVSL